MGSQSSTTLVPSSTTLVNKLAFIDDSGSTIHKSYPAKVGTLVTSLREQGYSVLYFSTSLSEKGPAHSGGTETVPIANYLCAMTDSQLEALQEVLFVTDGEVPVTQVESCKLALARRFGDESKKIPLMICHFVPTCGNMNTTVLEPFCSYAAVNRVSLDFEEEHTLRNLSENQLIQALDEITLENFREKVPQIAGEITLFSYRNSASAEIATAARFKRDTLFRELRTAAALTPDCESLSDSEIFRLWSAREGADTSKLLERLFSNLISNCSKNGSLSGLFTGRIATAASGGSAPSTELPAEDQGECKITFEPDTMCVTLLCAQNGRNFWECYRGEAWYQGLAHKPFLALNALSNHMGTMIGWGTFLKLSSRSAPCPYTRLPIGAAFPLGCNEDSVRYADWALRKFFYGNKKVGTPAVLLMAIHHLMTQNPERYADVMPLLEENIRYRVRTQKCAVSMCGLEEFPKFPATIARALRFVLASDSLLKTCSEAEVVSFLRFSGFSEAEQQGVQKRFGVVQMLREISAHKSEPGYMRRLKFLNNLLLVDEGTGLTARADGILAADADPVRHKLLSIFDTINVNEENLCGLNLNYGEIAASEELEAYRQFDYSADPSDPVFAPRSFNINPKTFWPNVKVGEQNGIEWCQECFRAQRLHSMPRDYIAYMTEHEKFPSLQEYVEYVVKRRGTVVPGFFPAARRLLEDYAAVCEGVPVNTVVSTMKRNQTRTVREANERV